MVCIVWTFFFQFSKCTHTHTHTLTQKRNNWPKMSWSYCFMRHTKTVHGRQLKFMVQYMVRVPLSHSSALLFPKIFNSLNTVTDTWELCRTTQWPTNMAQLRFRVEIFYIIIARYMFISFVSFCFVFDTDLAMHCWVYFSLLFLPDPSVCTLMNGTIHIHCPSDLNQFKWIENIVSTNTE